MAAIWFDAPLTCLSCGGAIDARKTFLHTPHFGSDSTDTHVRPGGVLDVSIDDFQEAYFTVHDPGANPEVRVLEQWRCPLCTRAQWARLEFQRQDAGHYRFVAAEAVPLTPDVVRSVHFVSRWMDLWVEANPEDAWLLEFVSQLRR